MSISFLLEYKYFEYLACKEKIQVMFFRSLQNCFIVVHVRINDITCFDMFCSFTK